MRLVLALFTVFATAFAGCAGSSDTDDAAPEPALPEPSTHVLAGTIEPAGLDAPTFDLLGAIGRGGPAYGAGEPALWAHLDGTLYAAFPGCDRSFYLAGPVLPTDEDCQHGLVFRSADTGASWTRLNQDGDGRYDDGGEGPAANGDADVTVDAAGTVWASNLGGGIQVHKSMDNGTTWAYVGDVVEENESADRQWMAASHPGHLIMAWMGSGEDEGGSAQGRAVIVNTTFDGGATWTGSLALGANIGWLGPVQFATDGMTAYVPFTQVESTGTNAVLYNIQEFSVRVGRTLDGGATWEVLDTGARITSNLQGGHWSGVNMAPALDVTGDGTVVVAWSEDVNSPGDATATGARIMAVASTDGGADWTAPVDIGRPPTAIMPWVVGGAGDRFAVVYFVSDVPADPDYTGGAWSVMGQYVDGIASGSPSIYSGTIEENVHQGGICSRGGACLLTGSDRALLDYFEADLLPDGRLVVVYPADPLTGGKYIEIRFAVQSGGTFLLERAGTST